MDIQVTRFKKGENSTLSTVTVDGKPYGYILEDKDRGLSASMPLSAIAAKKVHGRTAIPTGKYRVTVTRSPRFKRVLPRLLDVPGYDGILIHAGNNHLNTEGCLLPGKAYIQTGDDYLIRGGTSKPAFDELFVKTQNAIKNGDQVWITINSNYDA